MNFLSSIFKPFGGIFGRAYDSAETTDERKDPPMIVADARAELSSASRLKLLSKTRALARNFGFARELVGSMEIYAVGDGIFPQPSTDDEAWNADAEALFLRVMARPELSGRFTFGKLTRLTCRALDTDGEIFFVKIAGTATEPPRLQVFEAHRTAPKFDAKERIFDGIGFDAQGRPIRYFFTDDAGEEIEVAAEHVIHVFVAERVSDAHGVPQIQHSVNTLTDTKELLQTEKKAVKTINELTFAIESERNSDDGTSSGDFVFGGAGANGQTDPDAFKRQIGGGKVGRLLPGEKLHEIAASRPSSTFNGFIDFNSREACLGNIPYEFVADSSKIGGAGVRLTVGRAARVFSRRQQELIEMFLEPVWRFFVGWAISTGRLRAIRDFDKVEWACPKKVTVDAGREAAQDRADVAAGLISYTDLYAERGMKYRRELRRLAADKAAQLAAEKEFGLEPGTLSGQRTTEKLRVES